jgi:hypothetical protein
MVVDVCDYASLSEMIGEDGLRFLDAWDVLGEGFRKAHRLSDQLLIACHFRPASLVIEQPLLAPQAAAVPAERPVGSNDTMARDDDANHVRAVRATNRASRIFITQTNCHPGIRTRFADRNRLQDLPRTQLEGRSNRSQRNFKLQLLAGEIILQLETNSLEIPMFPGHYICAQSFPQNR